MSKTISFDSKEAVMAYYQKDKENNCVVLFEGKVYDVKEYMPDHPGGAEYLLNNLGTNIEQEFEDAEHTKAARKTLYKLPVVGVVQDSQETALSDEAVESEVKKSKINAGEVANLFGEEFESKYEFDYDKPLLAQIYKANWTFKEYSQYINEPKILTNPVRDIRLFEAQWAENLSMAPWYVVPIVWGIYLGVWYLPYCVGDWATNLSFFCLGFLFWTFGEYSVHRFLFHGEDNWMHYMPESPALFTAHFLIHGIHHAFPSDRFRLVFPPFPGIIIGKIAFEVPLWTCMTAEQHAVFFVGFYLGYVIYDMIHYYFHHGTPSIEYFRDLKVYHMQHHYKFGQIGYGVSSKFWDIIFDTKIPQKSSGEVPQAKY